MADHYHHPAHAADSHIHHPPDRGFISPPDAEAPGLPQASGAARNLEEFHRQTTPHGIPAARLLKWAKIRPSRHAMENVAETMLQATGGGAALMAVGFTINAVQYPFTGHFQLLPHEEIVDKAAKVAGLALILEWGGDKVLHSLKNRAARSLKNTPAAKIFPSAPPPGGASEAIKAHHARPAHMHASGWLKPGWRICGKAI